MATVAQGFRAHGCGPCYEGSIPFGRPITQSFRKDEMLIEFKDKYYEASGGRADVCFLMMVCKEGSVEDARRAASTLETNGRSFPKPREYTKSASKMWVIPRDSIEPIEVHVYTSTSGEPNNTHYIDEKGETCWVETSHHTYDAANFIAKIKAKERYKELVKFSTKTAHEIGDILEKFPDITKHL